MSDLSGAAGRIRVGPAGWSYKDWEGVVYPPHGSRFDALAYLAHYVDTIEVNSSFYRIPPPTHATSWLKRIDENPEFRFTVKLFRGFTHERGSATDADVAAFRRFLDPLLDAGRLGALLIQYPWSFKSTEEELSHLLRVRDQFRDVPSVVEVRHSSLQTAEFIQLLDEHGLGFANIDQPLFGDSVKPSSVFAGKIGYIRLHGRNYQKWFSHQESWERYDYLYSDKELAPWIERAEEMSSRGDVYVVANNHFRGQAMVNVAEMKRGLGQDNEVPPQLIESYPERLGNMAGPG